VACRCAIAVSRSAPGSKVRARVDASLCVAAQPGRCRPLRPSQADWKCGARASIVVEVEAGQPTHLATSASPLPDSGRPFCPVWRRPLCSAFVDERAGAGPARPRAPKPSSSSPITRPRVGSGPPVLLAVLSDIHGNLPALEAVLAVLEDDPVDELVCLGDVAVGPQPTETLDRIRTLGCPVVMGNWGCLGYRGLPAGAGRPVEAFRRAG
jgi:Calcineurin-like phosphoesterase superfamily domain